MEQPLDSADLRLDPAAMKQLGSVDERYQSYNIEMVELVGGEFWRPYRLMDSLPATRAQPTYDILTKQERMYRKMDPVQLGDERLRTLARGLAPAYVRVSGTWANAIHFQDDDKPQMAMAPTGFVNVLTRSQWKGVIDFIKATDSKLVTSFTVSNGVRDAQGVWTPREAQKLVDYTRSLGGEIAAAELFNEPTMPSAGGELDANYNAEDFAKDIAVFTAWARSAVPEMRTVGPGCVGEGFAFPMPKDLPIKLLTTADLMGAEPKPHFDVFSYHYYGNASKRMMGAMATTAEQGLADGWLRRTDTAATFYAGLRDQFESGKPLWITETAQAAAGGDPYAATFADCFRYLYQLGSLATKDVKVIMHNTLAASEYSLIDQDTHLPKPNYWAALLWAKLMGTEVYDAGQGAPGLYVFAHDLKGKSGGMSYLLINTNDSTATVQVPAEAEQYTLTSDKLEGTTVLLNGQTLALTADDQLPAITGVPVAKGTATLPARSVCFITFRSKGGAKL